MLRSALYLDLQKPTMGRFHYNVRFCNTLTGALANLPRLVELHIDFNFNEQLCSNLRKAFTNRELTLPVKTLGLVEAPNAAFAIESCPHLRTLIATKLEERWTETLAPLLTMTALHQLEIYPDEFSWTYSDIRGKP